MTKIELKNEHDKAMAAIQVLKEAVIWMSGSQDFAPGGKARRGWLKLSRELDMGAWKIRG